MFTSPPARAAEHHRTARPWPALCLTIVASLALAALPVTPAFADAAGAETAAVASVAEAAPVVEPVAEPAPVVEAVAPPVEPVAPVEHDASVEPVASVEPDASAEPVAEVTTVAPAVEPAESESEPAPHEDAPTSESVVVMTTPPCHDIMATTTTDCDPCADTPQKTTTECDPCAEASGLAGKHDQTCTPPPLIEIDLTGICPVAIEITITGLVENVAYRYFVGDVEYHPTVSQGAATITLNEASGDILVAVTYDDTDVSEYSSFPPLACPTIDMGVFQCPTIDGFATLFVDVTGLLEGRDYMVEIAGSDFLYSTTTEGMTSWWSWVELSPGDYTVTVWSEPGEGPAVGPVQASVTLEPCPADVVITIIPRCGSATAGTLGASLSGLVIGREYTVTVEGADGLISEVTFVATSTDVDVTPSTLPPGIYTVTVIDTMSGDSSSEERAALIVETLRWSAEAAIVICPPLPSTGGRTVPALAVTGSPAGSPVAAALLLLPLGGLLIAATHVATRRRVARDRVSES